MYEEKQSTYYRYCRDDLLAFVPRKTGNRILEIGAGSGDTLLRAKASGLAEYIVGIDVTALENGNQSHPGMDRFIIGNIEDLRLVPEEQSFDVILCGDVLEHLLDPWKCLLKLRPLLRDGGVIIASIPNVRYWKVSMGLLFGGRWEYCERGVLDRTHLRFFVRNTIASMFHDAGFRIQSMNPIGPQRKWGFAAWAVNAITLGCFSDLLTISYIVVAGSQ